MGLTQTLCTLIDETTYDALGSTCVERVKEVIKDGLAVALAGCRLPQIQLSVEHARSLGGAPQASVWGRGVKASTVQAAYINGAAMHVLDFEPMWKPSTHALSPTLPVALALAESRGATGSELITAVANGLEMQGRMLLAGNRYTSEQMTFHPPGVVGVLGSAVTASKMLRLGIEQMQHAIGLAGSRAGSLVANIGSMTKCTHCGNAAASGLDAALLAARGFTANPDVIETRKGIGETFYAGTFHPEKLLEYGRPFRVVDPGMAIKLFPAQYATHYAITAALELAPEIRDKSAIDRVCIVSPVSSYIDRPQPRDGLEGKHSLQYTTAAALLDGAVTIETFHDDRRFRSDMVALLEKTELRQDAKIPAALYEMRVELEVVLRDGQRIRAECRGPKGVWGRRLHAHDHRTKLEDCLGRELPPHEVLELLERLDALEQQDQAGIARIASLMSAGAGQRIGESMPDAASTTPPRTE